MIIFYVLFTLFALGLSVFLHELGHFISAISVGGIVKEFSIGFGPPIKTWKIKGIQFSLRWIFFGGFVNMVGTDPNDPQLDNPRSFQNLSFWRRLLVLVSGVLSNLFFALIILFFINWIGYMSPVSPIEVTSVAVDSPAQAAGIQEFDIIYRVDEQDITRPQKLSEYLQKTGEQPVKLSVLRNEQSLSLETTPYYNEEIDRYLLGIGIESYYPPVVRNVQINTPAKRAGIEAGDVLFSVGDNKIQSFAHFNELIKEKDGQEVSLTVLRDGEHINTMLSVNIFTIQDQKIANTGIEPEFFDEEKMSYAFFPSIRESVREAGLIIVLKFAIFSELFQGNIPLTETAGPVGIMQIGAHQAQVGQVVFWRFIALLNIILFLLNILPIPVLDGGHILFLCIEKVIKKPIPHRVQALITQVFFGLILAFAILVTLNDILRIFSN